MAKMKRVGIFVSYYKNKALLHRAIYTILKLVKFPMEYHFYNIEGKNIKGPINIRTHKALTQINIANNIMTSINTKRRIK